ncbi:hypothetical protein D3C81_1769140 [compost metagenome]
MRAVEGGAGIAGQCQRTHRLTTARIESQQRGAGRGPDVLAVEADAVDAVRAGKWAVITHHVGRTYLR